MKVLGLDIGTTTISAVVMEGKKELASLTRSNGAFLPDREPWEKLQDVDVIRTTATGMVRELFEKFPDMERIGVTGQMHGIVYLDGNGVPVSPLYTWQDGRGDRRRTADETYAGYLSGRTGYPLASGYGLVTHFYNMENGIVPENAAVFCTIQDYMAMALCGKTVPVTDASDAASFGAFDVQKGCFDADALQKAGIDANLLPKIADDARIGSYCGRAEVYAAIGDNQASFLGATGGKLQRMLVNVGTGSQFSAYSRDYRNCPGLETRPFPGGGYLLVGASLCGGRAYAMLEQFFTETAGMLGIEKESCYDEMAALLQSCQRPKDIPAVSPLFSGTRQNPELCGSITGLGTENFTPLHLIWGMLEGMAQELYEMYERYREAGGRGRHGSEGVQAGAGAQDAAELSVDAKAQDAAEPSVNAEAQAAAAILVGSGNGLRKNPFLQSCIRERFGMDLILSQCSEEAAVGAAMFAASAFADLYSVRT